MPKAWRLPLAVIAFVATTVSASGTQQFLIIVHPSVQGTKITKANLAPT